MRSQIGAVVRTGLIVASVAGMFGCRGRVRLEERSVAEFGKAERAARGYAAYERVRKRLASLKRGMSAEEVEVTLGAVMAVQGGETGDAGGRQKLIDGLLCTFDPTPVRQRWLFGYDEGGVELVGFALEFTRDEPDDTEWNVQRIDEHPEDDCPDGAGTKSR